MNERVNGAAVVALCIMWALLPMAAAAAPAAAQPVATEVKPVPAGLQVWNAGPLEQLRDRSFDGPAPALQPLRVVAPRGGVGSGQVVVTDGRGLRGLAATLSDLRLDRGGTALPSAASVIRYGAAATDADLPNWKGVRYHAILRRDAPEAPVVPVWVTVEVPPDTAAGVYRGTLGVRAGDGAAAVPVELTVAEWLAPKPRDFRTRFDVYQSPDAVANAYGVELWSDAHWKLVERSIELTGRYGNKVLWVPLIANGTPGLTQSMARYARDGHGWKVDASRVDRYLELFDRHCGEPVSVLFYVWSGNNKADVHPVRGRADELPGVKAFPVTGTDGQAIEVKNFTPDAEAFWKAAMDAAYASVRKRGWKRECVMLGAAMDTLPSRFFTEQLRKAAPDATWVRHAHDQAREINGVKVGYVANARGQPDWSGPGWANPRLNTYHPYGDGPLQDIVRCRATVEFSVQTGHRGQGRFPADFWQPTGKPFVQLWVGGQPTMKDYGTQIFWPGQDGAEHTVPSLMLVEALQETEARVAVERAMADGQGAGDAAKGWKALIKDRQDKTHGCLTCDRHNFRLVTEKYDAANVQQRALSLYRAAAEATAAAAAR